MNTLMAESKKQQQQTRARLRKWLLKVLPGTTLTMEEITLMAMRKGFKASIGLIYNIATYDLGFKKVWKRSSTNCGG